MTPRERRLTADFDAMRALVSESECFAFDATGSPPDHYSVRITADGAARGMDGRPVLRTQHRFDVYLHIDYPRQAPQLRWGTPIFHPNILPPSRNGGVCIGSWSPSENLADLCRRILRMVSFESFSLADALDHDAAAWAGAHHLREGGDLAALVGR